ncbi:MAG TPA: type IV pilus secretin PilQ [Rhodanobacteraceae bacterium]|nr:type IV pilus secretin PilQ [Rhodanobacteraceae bacterium]
MNTFNAHVHAHTHRRLSGRWLSACLMLCAGLLLAAPAMAQHTLKDLSYQTLSGGTVEISLHFDGAAVTPSAFTTNDPPRIAFDFADTANTVSQRSVNIGIGSTSGATVVTAGGRTRVVVDLFRPASYRTRVDGDNLIITVGNGVNETTTAQSYAASDPSKAPPATGTDISNIDFRRGDNGAGRVIIDFNRAGAAVDMRREGGRVLVDIGQASLPAKLAQHLDVTDFATPVQSVETHATPAGARMTIAAGGDFEASAYQSGTQYVVEVAPKQAKKDDKKANVELGPDGRPKPVYTGTRVTFNFQDIPVRQVLHLIASESGLNIVVADTVSGQVTLRLVNVPWDQALDIVLRAKGLDKRRDNNVIWVAPQAEIAEREQKLAEARMAQENNAELASDYIPISYGKASDIAKLLTQGSLQGGGGSSQGADNSRGFLSPRGSVSYDIRTNTLLVKDTPDSLRKVRAIVAVLDKPVQQVLIESRIVVATDDFARELGVKFGVSGGYEDNNGNVITTTGSLNGTDGMINQALVNRFNHNGSGLPVVNPGATGGGVLTPSLGDRLNVNLPVAASTGSFGLAILGADYLLDLELSAAQTEGKSEIISSPRVITASQQPATITQGQQIGYQTVTSGGQGGGQLPQVAFKDATLQLAVTPTITNDKRVFLDLDVKKDSLAGYYAGATGQIPIIDHREIKTAVLVDDGATVVLGGILEVNKSDTVKKVPLLGDIPGIGALFRNKSNTSNRAELLVFVTPRILSANLQ